MRFNIVAAFLKVLSGYGSFFGLDHPLSQLLLCGCTMLHPLTGLAGFQCAASVMFFRKLFKFPAEGDQLDIVNGLLLGMLIGSLYNPSLAYLAIILLGALLVVIASTCLQDTLGRILHLPILGLPYVVAAYLLLPLMRSIPLAPLSYSPPPVLSEQVQYLHAAFTQALTALFGQFPQASSIACALGSMYFTGIPLGGILVFIAFLISSRYLALLAVAAASVAGVFLHFSGLSPYSLSYLVAQMNALLSACVIGGLYTVPSRLSLSIAMLAAILASLSTIFLEKTLWQMALPPLALPFILTTYLIIIAFSSQRGGPWLKLWLLTPKLPELSLEHIAVAQIRGLDLRSIALASPVNGRWQIYQGFDGKFTHKGNWRFALDLFQTINDQSYAGSGTNLSDYFCWGKPVVAPCWGRVIDVVNDINDNQPGQVNTINNWGNYLLIQLDGGGYVVLAHLQKNSTKVTLGARVVPGQSIACCGNSGRSPQPHLHMHVQGSPQQGAATIPFHLSNILLEESEKSPNPHMWHYSLNACPPENSRIVSTNRNAALKKALGLAVGKCFDYEVSQTPDALPLSANRLLKAAKVKGTKTPGELKETEKNANNATAKDNQTNKHDNALCPTAPKRRLTISLDINGQFFLESNLARLAFTQSDDLIAFFDRQGKKDLLIDAFALACGLTPLVEGAIYWHDAIPKRIFPLPSYLKAIDWLCAPCSQSTYTRIWDAKERLWLQKGEHRLSIAAIFHYTLSSKALLCEQDGLLAFEISQPKLGWLFNKITKTPTEKVVLATGGEKGKKKLLLGASLAGYGIREDNGIPETIASRP
jgi:urea transporter